MDRDKYAYHVRDRLIDAFRREIGSMTDDEVLEFDRTCIFCARELIRRGPQDLVIMEGTRPDEIDEMLRENRDHDCPFLREGKDGDQSHR